MGVGENYQGFYFLQKLISGADPSSCYEGRFSSARNINLSLGEN